jgi:hypothetical protein
VKPWVWLHRVNRTSGVNLCAGRDELKGESDYSRRINGVEPFGRLTLLAELSQVPVPLPRITRGSSQRILELREAVHQQGGPAWQDRGWSRIAHNRGVVCKYPK